MYINSTVKYNTLSSFYRFIDDFTGVIFLSIYPPFIVFHMWNTVLYCIVLYCIVLYCTVLFKYVIFHIWNTVLVSDQSQLFVAKCKQKCTHVLCSTVQYMYSSVQCSDRGRGGWMCDFREWWKVWGWKKLQKDAEVKEEMRYEILFCYFPRWKIILPQG